MRIAFQREGLGPASRVLGLALEVVWFDEHMLEFKLSAGNGRFAGETAFYAELDASKKLAAALEGFPNSRNDLREYEFGGSGVPGYGGAKIRLACKDGLGHLAVRVDVLNVLSAGPGVDTASVNFNAVPATVDGFVDELRKMKVEVGQAASLPHAVYPT